MHAPTPPLTAHHDDVPGAGGLLVLVHGFGHNETHMAVLGRLVDPQRRYAVVAPRGPIDLRRRGARAWSLPRRRRPEQFAEAVRRLDELVGAHCARTGLERSAVVLGGFSQGAILALAVAARPGVASPAGVLSWCGALPVDRGVELDLERLRGVPVLCQVATRDEVIDPQVGRAQAEALSAVGACVELEEHDAGHEVTLEMLQRTCAWLARVGTGPVG